jgi:hypothetical protein
MAAAERLDALDSNRVDVYALPQERSIVNPAILVPILDLYTDKQVVYRQETLAPPPGSTVATSPLRFNWEFEIPPYYAAASLNARDNVAIIASGPGQPLPDNAKYRIMNMQPAGAFQTSDTIFRFKALVYLYEPSG